MRDLKEETLQVERRIAGEHAQLLQAFGEYRENLRERATSLSTLGALVAVGFIAGALLQRRSPKPDTRPALGFVGVVASLATAIARARYGSPWTAVERLLARRREEQPSAVERERAGPT
jgi:hypothetical protein